MVNEKEENVVDYFTRLFFLEFLYLFVSLFGKGSKLSLYCH
jgi:hypothetical protein